MRLAGIGKRYARRGRWVLDGVDLDLPAGTATLVAGGNGSGKSTLLRIAAGASTPTRGTVLDRPAAVGYVPERLPARLRMTGSEYLRHLGRIRGLPDALVRERAAELFDALRLAPGPDTPVGTLSKGNSQKVALAQALLAPVGLLVLDEPYSGLDGAARTAVDDLLGRARADGAALLLSAHALDAAPATAAYRIAAGRLALAGAPFSERLADDDVTELPVMRIELNRASPDADPAVLAALRGVRVVRDEPLTLDVRDADAVLLIALRSGWSLKFAGPR